MCVRQVQSTICTHGSIFSNWQTTNLVVVVATMLVFFGVLLYVSKPQLSDQPIAAGDRVILTGGCPVAIVAAVRGMTVKVKKERGGVW